MTTKTSYMQRKLADDREAAAFAAAGLSEYLAAGVRVLPVARMWSEAGFNAADAAEWRKAIRAAECDMLPADAAEWRAAGFTAEEAVEWHGHYTPAYAAERRSLGYTSRKAYRQPMRTR